jgi:ribosome-associated protein
LRVACYKLLILIGVNKIESKELALRIALVSRQKKAEDVVVLDMRKVCTFCEYFVILSADSLRQVNAFSDAIQQDLLVEKIKSLSKVSANDNSGWVVLDYSSVVVHVFLKTAREFYALENLWSDAKKIRVPKKQNKD